MRLRPAWQEHRRARGVKNVSFSSIISPKRENAAIILPKGNESLPNVLFLQGLGSSVFLPFPAFAGLE